MGLFGRSKKKPTPGAPPSSLQKHPQQQHQRKRLYEAPAAGQPAGYLLLPPPPPPPPPPASPSSPGPSLPLQYHDQQPYPLPIIVNQHYYLGSSPLHALPPNPYVHNVGTYAPSRLQLGSAANLATELVPVNMAQQIVDDGLPRWHVYGTQLLNQTAAMYDQICNNFDYVMTLIDRDKYTGNENDLFMYQPQSCWVPPPLSQPQRQTVARKQPTKKSRKETSKGQINAIASSIATRGYFAKVELYANSKLPLDLPPLRLYIPTYPLICLASQYSERVYENPQGAERDAHVDADWRTGTKAMRIKSVPMDHMDTIVFAVRGTATFMDWAVNLNTAPAAPIGFLDESKNLCHAGFLSVARKMIAPVAARLRHLLEEDPRRCSYSLLITGHSAGGAVASLLYAHMLATSKAASSELNSLTGCFKRVHCITFGTPPISLFPLQKPNRPELKKFVFLSFMNEGDPVARADKAYVKSLLELFTSPAPTETKGPSGEVPLSKTSPSNRLNPLGKASRTALVGRTPKEPAKSIRSHSSSSHSSSSHSSSKSNKSKPLGPIWKVPPSILSNAGQIVVLRSGRPNGKIKRGKTVEERLDEGVIAQLATYEQLGGLIWGDPVCHVMKLYAGRIEMLAVEAVTARGH
ncbi:hypothetical protein AAE478_004042 [Parahypoxylon ruwenzoriense]